MEFYKGIKILGTGSFVPGFTAYNDDFKQIVETDDQWITERTGIKSRHFVKSETSLDLAAAACEKALDDSGIDRSKIGLIIAATCSGDYLTPSLACTIQERLPLGENILAFDLNAACSGFVYSINAAFGILQTMPDKYALVVGCEVLSRVLDFSDRSSCVLFGDGAGAAVVSLQNESPFLFDFGTIGDHKALYIHAEYRSSNPFTEEKPQHNDQFLRMDGTEVYRFAVENFPKSTKSVLEKAGITAGEIDHYICHQANLRILHASAKKLGVSIDKFFVNIADHGNTSAASVAIALDDLNRSGKLHRGEKLVLAGFGGGLTYGTAYMTW